MSDMHKKLTRALGDRLDAVEERLRTVERHILRKGDK
jgi:hypothetical protein